jgi:hypothetical protein
LPIGRAVLWSILGAYLLLPVGAELDLPFVPPLGKVSIPNLAIFFCCRFILGRRIEFFGKASIVSWLLLIYIANPFVTASLNLDPTVSGGKFIQGMTYYDALSSVINQFIFIVPFMLGRQFLNSATDHEDVLRVLAVAGLFYSLPMLFEVRMSPQLHTWIYGYFPHSFLQQMRGNGFRPVVFLGHGLLVAFFTMTSLVAIAALTKLNLQVRKFSAGQVFIYLGFVLILCKSLASLIYGATLSLVVRFLSPVNQMRIAIILVFIAFSYPVMRVVNIVPISDIADMANSYSSERSQSFSFRIDNEEMLLDRLDERSLFGWGSWGRGRVYNPESGEDITVTDGRWIIVMSQYGYFGYIAEFGLLVFPIIACFKRFKYLSDNRDRIILSALCLILSINVFDLLINASNTPFTWLLAGALLGRANQLIYKTE